MLTESPGPSTYAEDGDVDKYHVYLNRDEDSSDVPRTVEQSDTGQSENTYI